MRPLLGLWSLSRRTCMSSIMACISQQTHFLWEHLVISRLIIIQTFFPAHFNLIDPLHPPGAEVPWNDNPQGTTTVGAEWFVIHLSRRVGYKYYCIPGGHHQLTS